MANIIKGRFDQPFVMLYNEAVQDPELSAAAKGVHAYLLSLPGDWTVRAKELHNHFKNGRDAIISALNELVDKTYVERKENRDGGKYDGVTYIVYPVKYKRAIQMGLIIPEGQEQQPQPQEPPKEPEKQKENIPFAEILDYLFDKTGKRYKPTGKEHQKWIRARWNDGHRLEDFKKVIDNMSVKWLGDQNMDQYLRPSTLFGTKFEAYLNVKTKSNGPLFPKPPNKPQTGQMMTEEQRAAMLLEAGIQ